jgi:CheY-like chemotaxis protein
VEVRRTPVFYLRALSTHVPGVGSYGTSASSCSSASSDEGALLQAEGGDTAAPLPNPVPLPARRSLQTSGLQQPSFIAQYRPSSTPDAAGGSSSAFGATALGASPQRFALSMQRGGPRGGGARAHLQQAGGGSARSLDGVGAIGSSGIPGGALAGGAFAGGALGGGGTGGGAAATMTATTERRGSHHVAGPRGSTAGLLGAAVPMLGAGTLAATARVVSAGSIDTTTHISGSWPVSQETGGVVDLPTSFGISGSMSARYGDASRRAAARLDLHVLCVEDEVSNSRLLRRMLERIGCSCTMAQEGDEAFARLVATGQVRSDPDCAALAGRKVRGVGVGGPPAATYPILSPKEAARAAAATAAGSAVTFSSAAGAAASVSGASGGVAHHSGSGAFPAGGGDGAAARSGGAAAAGSGSVLDRPYSFVLLDIVLGSTDGVHVMTALRRAGCVLPIIAVTGNGEAVRFDMRPAASTELGAPEVDANVPLDADAFPIRLALPLGAAPHGFDALVLKPFSGPELRRAIVGCALYRGPAHGAGSGARGGDPTAAGPGSAAVASSAPGPPFGGQAGPRLAGLSAGVRAAAVDYHTPSGTHTHWSMPSPFHTSFQSPAGWHGNGRATPAGAGRRRAGPTPPSS